MAIAAHFDDPAALPGNPRAPRRTLRLEAEGALPSGEAARVLIHNVSATGLLLECAGGMMVGENLAIDLPQAGLTAARVVWASGPLFGCQFEGPLSPAALSAAELRSAAGSSLAPPPAPAAETMGLRLQRLRKARGLTQSQVAEALGVSKPTVWAWDHDKAHPVAERLGLLSALLDVPQGDLASGRDHGALAELLARARADIAAGFGTCPANVRIMIEL